MIATKACTDERLIYQFYNYALTCYTFTFINNHTGNKFVLITDLTPKHAFNDEEYDLYFNAINKEMLDRGTELSTDKVKIFDYECGKWTSRLERLGPTASEYVKAHLFNKEIQILNRLSIDKSFDYLGISIVK